MANMSLDSEYNIVQPIPGMMFPVLSDFWMHFFWRMTFNIVAMMKIMVSPVQPKKEWHAPSGVQISHEQYLEVNWGPPFCQTQKMSGGHVSTHAAKKNSKQCACWCSCASAPQSQDESDCRDAVMNRQSTICFSILEYPQVICSIAIEAMAHLVRWFTELKDDDFP